MQRQIAGTLNGTCIPIVVHENENPPQYQPQTGDSIAVSAPVGIGGSNLYQDVVTIQDALNRVSPDDGGASPPLAVDGICGDKTKKAIQQFQLKQFGWSGADGKINPGGQTITRLNEILGGAGNRPANGGSKVAPVDDEKANEIYKTMMTGGILKAKKWIYAAQHNLDAALVHVDRQDAPGTLPSFGRAERLRLVNRYFRIDEFPAHQRRLILYRIRDVYSTMLQIFERPGGVWGEKAFEIDSTGVTFKESSTVAAHTDYGGYFKGGKPNQFQKGLRADSVFFVRENIAYFMVGDNGTGTIVHELAHFCGDERKGWRIEDFSAYGEPEQPQVARLTLAQVVRHADTYTRFARAAGK